MRLAFVAFAAFFLAMVSGHVKEAANDAEVSHEDVSGSEDVAYVTPHVNPKVYFADHFDHTERFAQKWIKSSAKKDGVEAGIDQFNGEWSVEPAEKNSLSGDYGLVLKSQAKHAAISSRFNKPFTFDKEEPLIVQYEINYQNGLDCGGGYIKLLSHSNNLDLNKLNDKTPYTIMFGPDRCGSESKLHFIFRHVNPRNQSVEEKHVKKLETKERAIFEELFKDKRPHLFRLVINPDNAYEIYIDYKVVNHGSLLNDFAPPVNPPAEIEDPNDKKPSDWDEREKIADPEASKPADWDEKAPKQIPDTSASKPDGWLDDEPDMIPDPEAEKPDDWDDEMDGDWEAALIENPACTNAAGCGKWKRPMIDNPAYKGKWFPPMIKNPAYKGKWKPKMMPNPDYFHDPEPFKMTPISAVGIELWSMSKDIYFDNILVTSELEVADEWAKDTYDVKIQKLDVNNAGLVKRILAYSNKNPWLYAVYVVVIGLPLVLIVTFCCSGDASGKLDDHKKTDQVQEDVKDDDNVEQEEEQEEEEEAAEDEGGDAAKDSGDSSKPEPAAAAAAPRKRRARKE